MKILIGCPTCERYDYCVDLWVEAVKKIINFSKSHKIDYLLVDNSKGNEFFEKLKLKKVNAIRANHDEDVRERIVNSRNILRDKVLNEGYDYFFSLESDIIPEEDIIERLLSHNKKIVSAYYGKGRMLVVQDNETKEIKRVVIEMPVVYLQDGEMLRRAVPNEILGKGLVKVGAFGVGCMLVSNEVLKKIKFRIEKGKNAFDDLFFCGDAKMAGYDLFLESELRVRHLHKTWEENL